MAQLASYAHSSRWPAQHHARVRKARSTTATLSPPSQPHFGTSGHPPQQRPIGRLADLHSPPTVTAYRHAPHARPARPRPAPAHRFGRPLTPLVVATPQIDHVTHRTRPTAAPPARGSSARAPTPGPQTRLMPSHESRAPSYQPLGPARARGAAPSVGVAAGGVSVAFNGYNRPERGTNLPDAPFFRAHRPPTPTNPGPNAKNRASAGLFTGPYPQAQIGS